MDLLIKKLLAVVIPLVLFGLLFYHDGLYLFILLQNDHIKNWYFPRENLIDWADTLIMGNSLASAGINPDILQEHLQGKQTVWNIAQPGDTASIDYFNLQRIVATCRKCPKTIVYALSETSFQNSEITTWRGEIYDNLERLYIDTDEENETLREAAGYDSFYSDVYNTMMLNRAFRPYLLRRQLVSVLKKSIYESVFHRTEINASQINESPLVGYFGRHVTLTRANANRLDLLTGYLKNLKDYKIGKANELFFNKFILTARKKHIRVFIVEMPLSSIYLETAGNSLKIFHDYITARLEKSQLTPIDDRRYFKSLSMFGDFNHLNEEGAKEYTLHLAKEINRQSMSTGTAVGGEGERDVSAGF